MKSPFLSHRRILRCIFATLSGSAVAFIFQACYGTPRDLVRDLQITGTVLSASTGQPLGGITVEAKGISSATTTEADGSYTLYVPLMDEYRMDFHESTSGENMRFKELDTTITRTDNRSMVLNIKLHPAE